MELAPQFPPWAAALGAVVVAYLVLVEPWWGRRMYTELRLRREADPGLLVRFWAWGAAVWWPMAGLAVLIVLASPGVEAADLGLVPPADPGVAPATLAGFAAGGLAGMLALHHAARRDRLPALLRPASVLLPRSARERRWGAFASATAGVCEEVVFRGLLIALGVGLLGLPLYAAAALSLAVFVLAHLYQGVRGMLAVTLMGAALTVLYLTSGSLLLPVLVHVLIDLRFLALAPTAAVDAVRAQAPQDTGREPAHG